MTKPAELIKEGSIEAEPVSRLRSFGKNAWHTARRLVSESSKGLKASSFNWHLGPSAANPLYDVLQLQKSLGILYRGFGFAIGGALPVYGLYLGCYESAKAWLGRIWPGPERKRRVQLCAGLLAEFGAVGVWVPYEVVRQRMQLGSHRGFLECAEVIAVESGGWRRGLFKGTREYLAQYLIFSPLMFVSFEIGIDLATKARMRAVGEHRSSAPGLATNFAVGCASGALAGLATAPMDLVKTRIQCQTPNSLIQYRNFVHGISEVVRTEGPVALFRGCAPHCANMGLMTGVCMMSYAAVRPSAMESFGLAPNGLRTPPAPIERKALKSFVTGDPYDWGG